MVSLIFLYIYALISEMEKIYFFQKKVGFIDYRKDLIAISTNEFIFYLLYRFIL